LVNQRIRPAKMSFWQYTGPEAHEFHFVGKSWMYRRIDPARISGDSSGGSAVALACGMVPLAGYRPSLGLCRRPGGSHGLHSRSMDRAIERVLVGIPELKRPVADLAKP